MKKTYIFVFFCLCLQIAKTQNLSKPNKQKANALAYDAQVKFDIDDYYNALNLYRKALQFNPLHENAGVNSALCMFQLGYPVDSLIPLENNLTLSRVPDATFYLALIKHRQRKFDESTLLLQTYKKIKPNKRLNTNVEADYRIGQNVNAKLFLANPSEAYITNMGPAINSAYPDYVPVMSLDELTLYFTSKRKHSVNDSLNSDRNYFEDVYVSRFKNTAWQPAENLGEPINSKTNDACVALSPDGERMIVYRTATDIVSGDLFISRKGNNGSWQTPEKLPEIINSPYIETSACFSMDTSEIFFSSNRPGGYGGKDLYRVRKLPNHNWSQAYNLGPTVNTAYDEDAPFLHPDGVSLYFSSKGHNSMGGYDLFSSEYTAENNTFSSPENLGYPINDINDDIFFVVSLDGKRGYYSSEKSDSYGHTDIYKIDTRFKSKDIVVQTGTVMLDSLPYKSKLTVYELPDNQIQGIYSTHPVSGQFILALSPFKNYRVQIEAEGCLEQEVNLKALVTELDSKSLVIHLKKSNAQ
jgi:Tol biopolymer transport system component